MGALLAVIGGVWFVIGPSLRRLWAGGGMGMHSMMSGMTSGSSAKQALEAIGYHYGTGAAITLLASLGLGLLLASRRAPAPAAAAEPAIPGRAGEAPAARETPAARPEPAAHV